jgi:lysophospholipase L1-like esterase
MPAKNSNLRTLTKKWLFALLPLIGLLFCAEILIRATGAAEVCPGGDISSVLVCDPLLYFKINPKQVIYGEPINAAGFRGRAFSPKRPEVFRILTLGDSCTFGLAPPEFAHYIKMPYGRLLERMIEVKHGADRVEVLNAGNPGYNSYQGLVLMRTKLRDLEPDLVTVRFGWNDHLMSATSEHSSAFRESPNPILRGLTSSVLRSAIYQFAMRVQKEIALRSQGPARFSPPAEWQPAMSIAEYQYALREIATLARNRGAEVWFLTAPQAFHDAKGIARYEALPTGSIARGLLKFNAISTFARMGQIHESYVRATREVAKELDVPLVDMAALYAQSDNEALFSIEDGLHPGPLGHQLEARALYRRLMESNVLDRHDRQ